MNNNMLHSIILIVCCILSSCSSQAPSGPQYSCGGYGGYEFNDKIFYDEFGDISGFTIYYDDIIHAIQFYFGHDIAAVGQQGIVHGNSLNANNSLTVQFDKKLYTNCSLPDQTECEDEFIQAMHMDMGPVSADDPEVVICSLSVNTNRRHVGAMGTCHYGNCGTVSGNKLKYVKGRANEHLNWMEMEFCYSGC